MKKTLILSAIFALSATQALADAPEFKLSIKDHKFSPTAVEIPADTKIKLLVKNEDATPEEFESHELNREKVISGKSQATIFIGPLKPGEYKFFGEFHQDTAQGKIVVK